MALVHVRLFARLREAIGEPRIVVELPEGATIGGLRDRIGEMHPIARAILPTVVFAVDEEYVDTEYRLHDGDHVAIIPPVSGGADV